MSEQDHGLYFENESNKLSFRGNLRAALQSLFDASPSASPGSCDIHGPLVSCTIFFHSCLSLTSNVMLCVHAKVMLGPVLEEVVSWIVDAPVSSRTVESLLGSNGINEYECERSKSGAGGFWGLMAGT